MSTDPALCNDVLVSLGLIIGTASVASLAVLTLIYFSKLYVHSLIDDFDTIIVISFFTDLVINLDLEFE